MPTTDHALERIAALNQRIEDGLAAQRERAAYIRELHADGWTQGELADAVGITQQRISAIISKE